MFIKFVQTYRPDIAETYKMTLEIMHLAERIHLWLNLRVARHLAAKASKLNR
jgi:hypothetical protein